MIIIIIANIKATFIHLHGFVAASAADIAHKNQLLCLKQQNKSCTSKVNFRQGSDLCKKFIEAAKINYANKKTGFHFQETWLLELLAHC